MKVLVSGSHGLVGSALVSALHARGDTVTRLVRHDAGAGEVRWNPVAATVDREGLAGHDAIVHLAGESIFGYWTAGKKQRIRDSRVVGTGTLADAVAQLDAAQRPRVMVSASAIGYYGNRGELELQEDALPGEGFLAEVVREWEDATRPAADAGVRVVTMRTGIVQSSAGGALKVQLVPFRLGLGGPLAAGRMWFSWIDLDDLVAAYLFALDTESLSGPLNASSPQPVRNRDYTRALARAVGRPAFLRVPRLPARALMGELANELFASVRVQPARLQQAGFEFAYPTLEQSLAHQLD